MRILFLLFFCSFAGADPRVNEKILGGHNCKEDEARYHVSICMDKCATLDDIICGGTLIRPSWVLTAAHCDPPTEKLKVIIETHDVHNLARKKKYEVEKHFPHPHPVRSGVDEYFDIMLLHLTEEIKDRAIREPTEHECANLGPTPKTPLLQFNVSGLGICGYHRCAEKVCPYRSPHLKCLTIPQSNCHLQWNTDAEYRQNRFCAGGKGKDTRPGDSGGGLVIKDVVYGVVQSGCAENIAGDIPALYTNVCKFLPWIKQYAGETNAGLNKAG